MTQFQARVNGTLVSPGAPLVFTALNVPVTVDFRFDEHYRNTVAIPIILPAGFVARIGGSPVTEVPAHYFTHVDAEIDFVQTVSLPFGSSPSVVIAIGDNPSAVEAIPDTTGPTLSPVFTLTGGEGSLTFDWDAATDDVGVDHYEYQYSSNSGMTSPMTATTSSTGATVTPAAGTWYGRYRALDATGNASAWSSVLSATVTAAGDTTSPALTGTLTAVAGNGEVVLDWSDATDAVGVTGYDVEYGTTTGYGTAVSPDPSTSTTTITGLTNETLYYFRVRAHDAAGNVSSWLMASATPTAVIFSDAFTGADGSAPSSVNWDVFSKPIVNATTRTAVIQSNKLRLGIASSGGASGIVGITSKTAVVDVSTGTKKVSVKMPSLYGTGTHPIAARLYIGKNKPGSTESFEDKNGWLVVDSVTGTYDYTLEALKKTDAGAVSHLTGSPANPFSSQAERLWEVYIDATNIRVDVDGVTRISSQAHGLSISTLYVGLELYSAPQNAQTITVDYDDLAVVGV